MSLIPEPLHALVGVWSETLTACDAVEAGAVRLFAQAIMDDDPSYAAGAAEGPDASDGSAASLDGRAGGPIAPPLYPNHMLRRPYGTPDLLQQRAGDDDFDGVVPGPGLPPLTGLTHLPVLNAGAKYEFYRHARHGETVTVRQRYAELREKASAKGPLIFVVIESEWHTGAGELLLRARRTLLRRAA
jgi:hypothetical protein